MARLHDWRSGRLGHRDVARAVLKTWPKDAGRKLQLQSLANRIGDLHAAKNVPWWTRRSKVLQLVADALDAEARDLVGRAALPPGSLGFAEFPDLPPLAPTEEPCRLSSAGWMLHHVLAPISRRQDGRPRPRWVMAAPGAGKSLAVGVLRARHPGEVVAASVTTLADAAALSSATTPLVVEVDEARPRGDPSALRALEERTASTVILAPFAFPEPLWSGPGSMFGMSESGWESVQLRLPAGWRERLLEWVDRRLEEADRDTHFDRTAVLDWLAEHDPRETLIATPGALLALCADFDRHRADGRTVSVRARRWLRRVGPTMISDDAPPTWRARASAKTFEALVVGHLRRAQERHGCLGGNAWSELVPPSLSPGRADRPGEDMIVEHLRQAGLLRGDIGGVTPYPGWVALGVLVDDIGTRFDDKALGWGALAADESRQPIIDAALDALPAGALRALVRTVVEHADPRALAAVGATEATLAAVARRFDTIRFASSDRDIENIQRLVLRQIETLVMDPGYGEVHHPFTRPSFDEWFATAWTISLRVPAPSEFDMPQLGWELPGWVKRLSLATVPRHRLPSSHFAADPLGRVAVPGLVLSSPGVVFTGVDHTEGLLGVASPLVARAARLTLEIVSRLEDSAIPREVPRVLLPALFLSAHARGWELDAAHLDALHGSWDEAFLAHVGAQQELQHRRDLAARIWGLAAQLVGSGDSNVPVAERIAHLRGRQPGLVRFVLDNLDPSLAGATARAHGTHRRRTASAGHVPSDPRLLLLLPRAAREHALRGWLDGGVVRGTGFDEARELVPLLEAEDLDLALDLVRAADRNIAAEFTSFVWTSAPARARDEAKKAIDEGLPSAEGWFQVAPRAELGHLASLASSRASRPAWVKEWARRRVRDAGDAADALYDLATT